MKKTEKLKKQAELTMAKLRSIVRHIKNVEDNGLILGTKLIERGDIKLGHNVIANCMVHDASKFHGIEFEYLSLNNPKEEETKSKLKLAIHHHQTTNHHHPEYWDRGITSMPDVYVAEMVCDWKARSEEFGESLRDYINDKATKQYGFSREDTVYKKIMEFVDLICEKPFEQQAQL